MSKPGYFAIALIVLLVIYYLDCRIVLSSETVDPEEIWTWNLIQQNWSMVFLKTFKDDQLPIFYLLLKAFSKFFVYISDFWLRFPSMIFGMIIISAIFSFSYNLTKSVAISFIGSFLILHNDLFFFISTYARPYSLLVALVTINAISIFYFFDNKNLKKQGLKIFHLSLWPMAFTHHFFIVYLLSLGCTILLLYGKNSFELIKPRWAKYSLISLILCYGITHYIQSLHVLKWPHFLSEKSLDKLSFYIVSLFYGDTFSELFLEGFLSLRLFIIAILLLLLLYILRKKNRSRLDNAAVLSLTYIFITSLLYYLISNFHFSIITDRYFSIFLPFIFILIIIAINSVAVFINWFVTKLDQTLPERPGVHWVLMIFLFADLSIFEIYLKKTFSHAYRPDVKKFFKYMPEEKQVTQNDSVLCLSHFYGNYFFVPYSKMFFSNNLCDKSEKSLQYKSIDYKLYDYIFITDKVELIKEKIEYIKKKNYVNIYNTEKIYLLKRVQ